MNDRRPPLYLLTGIVIGFLLGLLIAYVILPVRYEDTSPATLSSTQKDVYRSLVGRAYLYEADSRRAFSRLALLQDNDLNSALVAQSQQMLAANEDAESAHGLALLANVFAHPDQVITPLVQSTAFISETATPLPITITAMASSTTTTQMAVNATATPIQPTATPFATLTPQPTVTPKPTQGAPYQLVNPDPKDEINCDISKGSSLLMVDVYDAAGNGVAGVQVEISLPNGGSTDFYTGLYPEINNGYADYTMSAGITYSIRVGIGGDIITGLSIPQCTANDGKSFAGNLELTFKQQ